MPYALSSLEVNVTPDRYFEDGFMTVLEDHIQLLIKHSETREIPVDPMTLHRYKFDLKRLMETLQIIPELHWVTMRMNNLKSMRDTPETLKRLLVPDQGRVQKLYQIYKAQNKIT